MIGQRNGERGLAISAEAVPPSSRLAPGQAARRPPRACAWRRSPSSSATRSSDARLRDGPAPGPDQRRSIRFKSSSEARVSAASPSRPVPAPELPRDRDPRRRERRRKPVGPALVRRRPDHNSVLDARPRISDSASRVNPSASVATPRALPTLPRRSPAGERTSRSSARSPAPEPPRRRPCSLRVRDTCPCSIFGRTSRRGHALQSSPSLASRKARPTLRPPPRMGDGDRSPLPTPLMNHMKGWDRSCPASFSAPTGTIRHEDTTDGVQRVNGGSWARVGWVPFGREFRTGYRARRADPGPTGRTV